MQITPISAVWNTLAVAPVRRVGQDKRDQGPQQGYVPAEAEEKRSWEAGEHLPPAYVRPEYRLSDPDAYELGAEPFGYRYVRVRDHIYLAQYETGYVRDVIPAPLP
jgi:Ni/Co efflux regulator RcnB